MSWLREHCPRLALARDQFLLERQARRLQLVELQVAELRLERLVAHRELQLIRSSGKREYATARAGKLKKARDALSRVQRRKDLLIRGRFDD